mmetsp:Transcript_60352/g.139138  ORF Transcript_60352/g.139138 Transcript_60352/m.139138 type:complete len:478 (+) Transcript_60352:50-1483(+)
MRPAVELAAALVPLVLLSGCSSKGPGPPQKSPDPAYNGTPAFFLNDTGVKALAYSALYLEQPECLTQYLDNCSEFPDDDVYSNWGEVFWSDKHRRDIANIATLGANAVRLYGNDDRLGKKDFLDTLARHNMKAITGMSNYFFADSPDACIKNQLDCHDVFRGTFTRILDGGEFVRNRYYHNAIDVVVIMNEPDIILGWSNRTNNYLKGMVSALDGLLSAEKDREVKPWKNGRLPMLSVAWSFSDSKVPCKSDDCKNITQGDGLIHICSEDYFLKDARWPSAQDPTQGECGPGIIFMIQLARVMADPEGTVGYKPKNNVTKAYQERWVHSFNVFNQYEAVHRQVLEQFGVNPLLNMHKTLVTEYNAKRYLAANQVQGDLEIMINTTLNPYLIGATYFEYQVSYNKMGEERDWGLFELTTEVAGKTGQIPGDNATSHEANCLAVNDAVTLAAVARAFNGTLPNLTCPEGGAVELVELIL